MDPIRLLCFSAPWKSGLDSERQQRSKTFTGHDIFYFIFRGWGRQKKLLAISTFVLSDKKDLGKLNISTRFLDQFILAP